MPAASDVMLQSMQERLNTLRTSQAEVKVSGQEGQGISPSSTAENIQNQEKWYTPASATLPYPGLDGHPRRITPIPISLPLSQPSVPGLKVHPIPTYEEVWQGFRQRDAAFQRYYEEMKEKERQGVKQGTPDAATAESTDQFSGTNRSTIGNTYIPPEEEKKIRDDVRAVMHQRFPGIQFSTIHNSGSGKSGAQSADMADSVQNSAPMAIAGSEVSVASTSENRGNAIEFSHLSQQVGAANQPQLFATTTWKPKEPPCFYGRSSEDVHTWTSLVRHYLTFMGGSDAQQVSYAVTLLREHAHEWFMGYERRNRHLPRDWASLASALLERFGSNIRSQEAQSQLMSISQGTRPVREYASQFELLMGRLDSFDEGMLLNQFVWGLQPELARSVSLHYPKSIVQTVSLAETTELATKASRRPVAKGTQSGRAPNQQNRGRGQWRGSRGRGGYSGRGGMGGGRRGGQRGGSRGGSMSSTGSYDPLACYRCGVRGHLARDCPQSAQSKGSGNAVPSRGRFTQSGQKGPRNRGRGRQTRFGAMGVVFDEEGYEYPIDEQGQLYVPYHPEQTVVSGVIEEEKSNETKN